MYELLRMGLMKCYDALYFNLGHVYVPDTSVSNILGYVTDTCQEVFNL